MKSRLLVIVSLLMAVISSAQDIFQNIDNRETTSLNGKWNYIVDPYELGYYGYRYLPRDQMKRVDREAFYTNAKPRDKSDRLEYDFDASPVLNVPGDWNSQDEKLFFYEGTIWYKKSFDYEKKDPTNRLFVHFGAVNYRADVYLNGKKLGVHEGGFTPFQFEITDQVQPKDNFLIVKVDNTRKREAVPTVNTDWWNYGGITRDVSLVETPSLLIADYLVQLKEGTKDVISGYVQLDGQNKGNQSVEIAITELKATAKATTDESGKATFTLPVKNLVRWTPGNPRLYEVRITSPEEQLADRLGFRHIRVDGPNILLNGKSTFLKGICIHEENPTRGGRAYSREDARMLLGWAKELGCNFVRLAHYPHNEHMVRMADEMGLLVWEEIPVYWTVLFDNPTTYELAEQQLAEVIRRDKNRASVIIWSVANETPQGDDRLEFLKKLVATARNLDDTRLISAAMEKHGVEGKPNLQTINDQFSEYVDVISFNQYIGWYDGLPEKCDQVDWEIPYNKPVIISEFGGGALHGYHGDALTRWSEEYQEDLYIRSIRMLKGIPQLRGMSPWILADFRSPRRLLPNIQDGWNRKGLISETGSKKKAFFVLKSYYEEIDREFR